MAERKIQMRGDIFRGCLAGWTSTSLFPLRQLSSLLLSELLLFVSHFRGELVGLNKHGSEVSHQPTRNITRDNVYNFIYYYSENTLRFKFLQVDRRPANILCD